MASQARPIHSRGLERYVLARSALQVSYKRRSFGDQLYARLRPVHLEKTAVMTNSYTILYPSG